MSQFMMIESPIDTHDLPSVMSRPLEERDDFLQSVAKEHFGKWQSCRLVTDSSGGCESIFDDIYNAQLNEKLLETTALFRLLEKLTTSGTRFVIWSGADHSNLPTAHSWRRVLELLVSQTRLQPADVYLRFNPS